MVGLHFWIPSMNKDWSSFFFFWPKKEICLNVQICSSSDRIFTKHLTTILKTFLRLTAKALHKMLWSLKCKRAQTQKIILRNLAEKMSCFLQALICRTLTEEDNCNYKFWSICIDQLTCLSCPGVNYINISIWQPQQGPLS